MVAAASAPQKPGIHQASHCDSCGAEAAATISGDTAPNWERGISRFFGRKVGAENGALTRLRNQGVRLALAPVMHPTTQQVIEFLSHPELPFGTEEDVLVLSDPQSLHLRVAALIEEFPAVLGNSQSQSLKARLGEADWSLVAQEFRARVELASGFFDGDANSSAHSAA